MARIRPYTTQVSVQAGIPSRSASASDFGGGAGLSALGAGAQNIGASLGDIEYRQEQSDILRAVTQFRADQTVKLAEAAANAQPGDPNFADTFLEKFDDAAAGLQDTARTASGQRILADNLAQVRASMTAQAGGFQVQSAGVKAKQDYLATVGASQTAVFTDPSQFDSVLQHLESALNDQRGAYAGMPVDARAELARKTKEDLALAAMRGTIRINPDQAQQDWDSGKYAPYIPGDKAWMVTSEINTAKTAREVNAARIAAAEEKAKTQKAKKAESDYITQLTLDATGVDIEQIATDPVFAEFPDMKKSLIEMARTGVLSKPGEIKTDPATFISIFKRIHLPDGDPRKITDEGELNQFVGDGLTITNLNTLRQEIQGAGTEAGDTEARFKKGAIDAAETALTGTNDITNMRDPKGDIQLQKFMVWFLPEYKRRREAGESALELTDPDNPQSLVHGIDRFKRSYTQFMKDLIDANPGLAGDDAPGGTAENDLAQRATKTATGKKGEKYYLVDGKWLDEAGNEVK